MLGVFERFRGRSTPGGQLDWLSVEAGDPRAHAGVLDALLDRQLDGITVRGVLGADEASAMLRRLPPDAWSEWTFGGLIGRSVGMVGESERERTEYFAEATAARALFAESLGFDPHQRIAEVLSPMAGGAALLAPGAPGRSYLPGQLRKWLPGRSLPAHIGNEFHSDREDSAVDDLAATTRVRDHLSYFVVLQAPESGGALSVYELTEQEEDGRRLGPFGLADRDDSFFDEVPRVQFTPVVGDLIVFGGGWRWHRVDPVGGSTERITYGGFCAPSVDGQNLHLWA